MTKRPNPMGDMTVDIAPPTKRLKVIPMPASENKVGTFDEKTVKN